MRQALPSNLLHNPFYNRFNDPVTQRRDEMQAYENMLWLRERNGTHIDSASAALSTPGDNQTTSSSTSSQPSRLGRVFADLFGL